MSEDISMNIGEKPQLRWVATELVKVDHNYQREIKPNIVAKILRKFSWSHFGCVSLAEQADGTFTVLDGQHRLAAAIAHPRISEIPASVIRASGVSEEATIFLGVNTNRTAVTTVERYWAGIEAGDAGLIRVRDILARAGCEVVPTPGPASKSNMTNAVSAIQRSIDRFGERAVVTACIICKGAWQGDKSALAGTVISALARLSRANPSMSSERMTELLRAKGRANLSADAENMRKISGGAAEVALAKALVEIYNKGLSKNQIMLGAAS